MTKKKNEAALAPPQQTQLAAPQPTVSEIVLAYERMASNDNITPEKLHMWLDAQERVLDRQAKIAYTEAVARFRAKCPQIARDQVVDYSTQKGRTSYSHAGLGGTLKQIQPLMSECGLSHSWRHDQSQPGLLTTTCILTHADGHSEQTSLTLPYDPSGSKNPIQAIGSASSYGERYTLFAILGLAAADDDDGRAGTPARAPEEATAGRRAERARQARQQPDRQPQPESEPGPGQNEPSPTNSDQNGPNPPQTVAPDQVEIIRRKKNQFKVACNSVAVTNGLFGPDDSFSQAELMALCKQAMALAGTSDIAEAASYMLSNDVRTIVIDDKGVWIVKA